jgi:hypothetical protein
LPGPVQLRWPVPIVRTALRICGLSRAIRAMAATPDLDQFGKARDPRRGMVVAKVKAGNVPRIGCEHGVNLLGHPDVFVTTVPLLPHSVTFKFERDHALESGHGLGRDRPRRLAAIKFPSVRRHLHLPNRSQ